MGNEGGEGEGKENESDKIEKKPAEPNTQDHFDA